MWGCMWLNIGVDNSALGQLMETSVQQRCNKIGREENRGVSQPGAARYVHLPGGRIDAVFEQDHR